MIKKTMTVHITDAKVKRPIAMFVQVCSQFTSRIYVENDAMRLNAKSIMGMMTLGMEDGKEINISVDGSDEAEAISAIEAFLTGAN